MLEDGTMRAVVYHGRKDVRVEARPKPRVEDAGDAVVRVTTAALCGSDLHLYHYPVPGLGGHVVLGHEQTGVVESVGAGVTRIRPGDRVVVSGLVADGTCWYCRQGLFSQCQGTNRNDFLKRLHGQYHGALFGFGRPAGDLGGGQAQFLRVPFADVNCLPLPDDVPDEKAVFLSDVLPVAWMATALADVGRDTTVAVWGCGPVGLLALASARARGAERLFAVDCVPERLRVARDALGAVALNFEDADPYDTLLAETDGRGPDVGIDATGFRYAKSAHHKVQRLTGLETDAVDAIAEMARTVRGGGTLVLAGFYLAFANQFPVGAIMTKNLTVRGSPVHVQRYWKELLEMVRDGALDPAFTVTHTVPLEEAPEAYAAFDEKRAIKVLFKPWPDAA